MFEKLLESIEKVSKFIKENGLFHSLSTMTQEKSIVVFANEESKIEQEKYLKIIDKNVLLLERMVFENDFKNNWLNLTQKEKVLIIFHHTEMYNLLRKTLERKDIVLTTTNEYVLKDAPQKLLKLLNLSSDKNPTDNNELILFKEDLLKVYPRESNLISQINLLNVEVFLKNIINKYCADRLYEIETIMREENLISGFIIFIMSYQDRLEKERDFQNANFIKIQ